MFPVCCEYCVLFLLYVVHLFRVVLHPGYYVFLVGFVLFTVFVLLGIKCHVLCCWVFCCVVCCAL